MGPLPAAPQAIACICHSQGKLGQSEHPGLDARPRFSLGCTLSSQHLTKPWHFLAFNEVGSPRAGQKGQSRGRAVPWLQQTTV